MKELYYVIQTLIHGRGANLIKVISLTLGLTVSILIFAREAFEFNYDTCYEDFPKKWKVPQQRISGGEELLFIRMTFVSVRVY